MKQICKKKICTGCGACVNVCPQQCISLKNDVQGFLYPEIDSTTCIDCGLCVKKCPQLKKDFLKNKKMPTKCYRAHSLDLNILKNSSSGGIFSELAYQIIAEGGVVFGAAMNGTTRVYHTYTEDVEGLEKLKGSKYIGSDIGQSFKQALQFLNEGRKVLFSGTPCQIDALLSFLNRPYENLYLVDFICHGVATSKILEKYIASLEDTYSGKAVEFRFRDKGNGYSDRSIAVKILIENEERWLVIPFFENLFGKMYGEGKINRFNCSQCKYVTLERVSDITLADYIDNSLSEFEKKNGASMVLVNSIKGEKMFLSLGNRIEKCDLDFEYAKRLQSHLTYPTRNSDYRNKIIKSMNRLSVEKLVKKYYYTVPKKHIFKRILKKIIKIIKSFFNK